MKARGGERYDEISTPPPSLKLSHRLCIVPLGTSCKKSLFHKSAILAVKMTIYWISYEVQKESQENLWPIAIFFKFFLLKASVFKNSFRKKCTKRYNTDLIRVKAVLRIRNRIRIQRIRIILPDPDPDLKCPPSYLIRIVATELLIPLE